MPVESLADYISDVERIIYDNDTTYAIYAHASAGCLHVRPLINLKTLKGRDQYRTIADAVAQTVKRYQGTITGEHGQGLVRGRIQRIPLRRRVNGRLPNREARFRSAKYDESRQDNRFAAARQRRVAALFAGI